MDNQREKELFDFVRRIAAYLPKDWRFNNLVDEKEGNPQLIGNNGAKVNFSYRDWRSTKNYVVSVSGSWPEIEKDRYFRNTTPKTWGVIKHHEKVPGINFSLKKRSPKAIAKDIKRRFLIEYQELYVKCLEEKKRRLKHRESIQHQLAIIERVAPVIKTNDKRDPECPLVYFQYGIYSDPSGEIKFNHRNSSDIKLNNIPRDVAIKVLIALSKALSKENETEFSY